MAKLESTVPRRTPTARVHFVPLEGGATAPDAGPTAAPPTRDYVLGHSRDELQRLMDQGRFLGDLTEELLRAAGLRPGMRVLDAGCGAGDVSLLAARLVGPTGAVVGVDRSPEAVALAKGRAAALGVKNVTFLTLDVTQAPLLERVDAVVGRLVLMYFADPAVALRRLAGCVEPGGIVAFHEFDLDGARSEPPCELFEITLQRLRRTFQRAGVEQRAGLKLPRIFEEAGLPAPRLMLHGRAEYGPDSPAYEQLAAIVRTILPLMERTGVATGDEVGIDTLAGRLREEAVARKATLVAPIFLGAWTRTPGA
jgi:SAM-dependent methyltransferase